MEIQVTSADGSRWRGQASQESQAIYKGWRCLHQAEGGYENPDHMPVVRPSINITSVPFSQPLQYVDYRINYQNKGYTTRKWRSTNHNNIAFCNTQGFEKRGDPRVDYLNREDLGKPLPKRMKGIICGGGFYTGTASVSLMQGIRELFVSVRERKGLLAVQNSLQSVTTSRILTLIPGVDAADSTKPLADNLLWADQILEKHHYFYAVTRAGDKINHFPQGDGGPVLVVLFLPKPAQYPLSWFEPWEESYLPDPLKIYHPI
jgi:hypothetical protein